MLFPGRSILRIPQSLAAGALLWSSLSILSGQERLPIHIQEWLAHRGDRIDYARIDSLASAMPAPLPRAMAPTREIVGYLPSWQYDSYLNLNYPLLTQINYFSAELDGNGNITNDHNWPHTELINFAHARQVKVKLCATLFDWSGTGIVSTFLSNSASRKRAIDNLLAAVQNAGADGVDIDIEPLPKSQRSNMVTFMQDLVAAFKTSLPGSIVTMATPAVDWSGAWNYSELADITDGLFIMAYDYHWQTGPTAGPVSPLEGFSRDVVWTVDDYLYYSGNQKEKLILGLPYYGYDWPVVSSTKYDSTTGSANSRVYTAAYDLAQNHDRRWDEASSAPWISYQSGGWRQVWYDDSLSLALKYQLALEKDLAGVGMWALGYDGDRQELWGALADHFGVPMVVDTPQYVLMQNYPNPFTTTTIIPYELKEGGTTRLAVYNLKGALVQMLVSGYLYRDEYAIEFIPVDTFGKRLASGIYLVALQVDNGPLESRRMTLQK
ncbi:glycosyl hydrolase family 18 protein [Candidatus Neomarinimicrobiota bacterium]